MIYILMFLNCTGLKVLKLLAKNPSQSLTIEDINTAEVIVETSIRIDNPEEGYFTINQ